jgi:hypothetical protein
MSVHLDNGHLIPHQTFASVFRQKKNFCFRWVNDMQRYVFLSYIINILIAPGS